MKQVLLAAVVAATVLVAVVVTAHRTESQSAGTTFDDSAASNLVVTAPGYRLTFSKTNGALLDIEQPSSGAQIGEGSNGGCLWGSVFVGTAGYIGGCSYTAGRPNNFSYAWNAGSDTLALHYAGDPKAVHHEDATVTVIAGSGSSFDMRLTLSNQAGSVLRTAIFPSELLFKTSAVTGGYLPYYLPGVRVKPAFFREDHPNVPTYPGGTAFADFLGLDIAGSHFAMYSVNPDPNPIQPVALGFIHNAPNNVCVAENFCTEHSFQTWVPAGSSWTSPTVRISIGQPIDAAILAYRHDNGVYGYPSVATKLGKRFKRYAAAPLIKADVALVGKTFRQWVPSLSGLPSPSLLHPVAYMKGGHDHSYPDFLPPDPAWGSEQDMAAMVKAARKKGLLVMPYTNPTWWTDDSRTVRHLPAPLTISDISALDENKIPVHETYGANGGYDVSPHQPFVGQRLSQDMSLWRTAVPVDCVFEDQIGARAWTLDLNPASPTPLSYSQGWLDHTKQYQQQCLMTENGWDRLAATETGFNGSLLTWERAFQDPDHFFGAGNWEAYPLALWLLHDKVLLYQHDLALETMSDNLDVLTWNLAFGMMLSYNWDGTGNWQQNSRLDLITWLQRDVAALYAGEPLTRYTTLASNVTQTTFPKVQITVNWSAKHSYTTAGYGIAPNGFLAQGSGGTVLAGAFSGRFNGRPLSGGTHYVIVERHGSRVIVRQPLGSDTALSVNVPKGASAAGLLVSAYDRQSHRIGSVRHTVRSGKLSFQYVHELSRRLVAFYQIEKGGAL
jgi:hypothetical protein